MDIILDALLDTAKILPFLLITYLVMEYLEHRAGDKTNRLVKKAGKFGPVVGSALGAVPQCGFSAAAANLFAGRVITLGTLVAIMLSTSDEMLPILISSAFPIQKIGLILVLKIGIGMVAGMGIDFLMRGHGDGHEHIHEMCESEDCHCESGIVKSAIKHTLQIAIFILAVNLLLGVLLNRFDTETLSGLIWNMPVVGQLIAGLIGLIPNCVASVVITQLYMEGILNFGTMMSGLLVNSGIALLVLFRVNHHKRENFKVLLWVYGIGVVAGSVLGLLSF